ncbi:hypothetical protein KVH02_15580 [Streptomyces olivaceus]|uniref:Uncharacterized protein n=1 Tax=Streptomyces olivaceus TaxID=47716 RepID=A0ABS7W2K3_STROV|nr:hypothetical protein [Streptomyces olivaceus]MBZ6089747.1 hypothetical protein [Streptomyces olivaceus]MBZ6098258.1 hypothetical protein [Streptomyces olivaceus]MBZ6119061.1 hypothetical protein [Streptomyces olivaceus]MBZ6152207.1 hypothetical protein [Streptomyces olivaceus]MBZ6300757.1 hypothetical protein [Streptomyces olivaceus]
MAPAATVVKAPPSPQPTSLPFLQPTSLPSPSSPLVPRRARRREDLQRIVVPLRPGLPVDRAFDIVVAVIGSRAAPAEDDVPALAERFLDAGRVQGHHPVLVHAVAEKQSGEPGLGAYLVASAHDVLGQPTRTDGTALLGRRPRRFALALTAQDLLELLQSGERGRRRA